MQLGLRPADWLSRRRLDDLPDTLFFHARDKLAATLARGGFRLLTALADHAIARGWGVELLPYQADTAEICLRQGGHLHVFLEDRPGYAANAFYAVPSYLRGYWYFDEIGTRNNSSHRLRRFDERLLSDRFAKGFHDKLAAQFIGRNFSKFRQAPRGEAVIAPGCLALFAQDFQVPRHHKHYLTMPELIEAAIAVRKDRVLYIKPHPNNSVAELAQLARYHAPDQGVFVTQASIHDLLAACACVLTLTSAVGFEAFLHRKPVVLAGQTDFAQNAITLTDAGELEAAIAAALAKDWPYEKFLTWFLRQNCVEDHPRALPIVLERLHAKGIRLGDPGQGFY